MLHVRDYTFTGRIILNAAEGYLSIRIFAPVNRIPENLQIASLVRLCFTSNELSGPYSLKINPITA
jgi:hypothetical protein